MMCVLFCFFFLRRWCRHVCVCVLVFCCGPGFVACNVLSFFFLHGVTRWYGKKAKKGKLLFSAMWRFPSCSPLVVSLHVCMACIHPTVGPAGVRRAVADGAWRSQRGREAGRSRRARVLDIAESASRTTSETLMPTGGIKDAPSPYSKAEELHAAAERKHSQLCSHELEEAPVMAAHDPAAVVKLDSRRRQIHLSHIQRELIWKARRQQYQQLLVRIVVCLESHLSPIEKCHALLSLHEEVIKKRIRLRSDTYEDIFHIFYAVATLGSAAPTLADEEAVDRRGLTSSLSSLLPAEFAGNSVAASSLLAGPLLQSLWTMYRYMIDSGTNPTARTVQYMMGVLERSSKKDAILEARAHSLMMDLDRFHLTPTEYTIAAYVGVCDRNGVMHLAVARVTDYRTRHEKQVSPGIYARLLFGLAHNHQYDEAISCLTTIDSVAVTPYLLNAILHVARHSRSPLSAFTFYKSVIGPKGNNIAPTSHTISILLEAMCASECYDEIDFLLCEMRRHRVKGNNVMLNKLLGVLLKLKRHTEGMALCRAMEKKGIMVFDELRRECEDFSTTPHR